MLREVAIRMMKVRGIEKEIVSAKIKIKIKGIIIGIVIIKIKIKLHY